MPTEVTDSDASSPSVPSAPEARRSAGSLLKFLLPSAIGVLMFLTPISLGGPVSNGWGLLASWLEALAARQLPVLATAILCVSAVLPFLRRFVPAHSRFAPPLRALSRVGPLYRSLRLVGAAFAVMALWQIGPEWIWSRNTGGVLLMDLMPVLITGLFAALILLPFLLEFGLMEFVGTVVARVFRWVFRLPGRAAIDASASWLGAGAVGVLITMQQYERGFYTQREAAAIATNFSISSIAFADVVARFMDIHHLFMPFTSR